jgi:hypothetical protein
MADYLTQADVQNYGHDLIDLAQRAAAQVTAPPLEALGQQNAELHRQLAIERRRRLDADVEEAIPNYREIDRDPRWHDWLRGHDSLNGRIRQELLNEAIATGITGRVLAFFRGFMSLHNDPGQPSRGTRRVPTQIPYDQRVYTRQEVAKLYDQNRRGAYRGREAEWGALERDIIAAGREGRILNPIADVAGK